MVDLVLGVELLLELGDLPLLGGGEVLGVVPAHLAPASLACLARRPRALRLAVVARRSRARAQRRGGWRGGGGRRGRGARAMGSHLVSEEEEGLRRKRFERSGRGRGRRRRTVEI